MRTELISIGTDTLPLDGAWHEPEGGVTSGAVMLCHGNTMNFYTGSLRFLPPVLTELGYGCLAFNRRGHDILSIRDSRAAEGAAFQTTAEGIADNEYAGSWLRDKGYDAPVVMGHSNGGFLAVQHVANHPETPALVLLSAHAGGKSAESLAAVTGLLGGAQTPELREKANRMIAEGRGGELMLLPGWWYVAFIAPSGVSMEMFSSFKCLFLQIKCSVYYMRGDKDRQEPHPAEDFAVGCTGAYEVKIVKNCDHFYKGREDHVAGLVQAWIRKTLIA